MKDLKGNDFMQEMSMSEMENVNGGGISLATTLAIAGAAIYVYNNWGDFCEGVKLGWNSAK